MESMTFGEWIHDMRKVLREHKLEHVLDTPLPEPSEDYSPMEDYEQVSLVLLDMMSTELSDSYPYYYPFHLVEALKSQFSFQICHASYKFYGELSTCKLMSGGLIRVHKAKFYKILKKLADIGHPHPKRL